MEGQSSYNFFNVNYKEPDPNQYNILTGGTPVTTSNMIKETGDLTAKMEELDRQLEAEGLKIKQLSDQEKRDYVNSLSEADYQRLNQYKDAGYSFGGAKALVDLERYSRAGGGYRGEGFALTEPVGGENSVWNRLNPIGRLTEMIDNSIQTNIGDFDDGDNEAFSFSTMLKNIPGSALKTISATARGLTNPLDTLNMLKDLVVTEEGRDILKERYGSWDGILNTIEKDPVGIVSDMLAVVDGGASLLGTTTKVGSIPLRLAGASRIADRMGSFGTKASKFGRNAGIISDLGLTIPYENILNSSLGKLAQGGTMSQLAGDYLSMTQRPLQTIWKGANPLTQGEDGRWVYGGVQNGVNRALNSMKEKIQTSATGLTPEVRERIRQNPFIQDYRNRVEEMLNNEGAPMDNQRIMQEPIEEVGKELLRRLEEYESKLEENGKEYQKLRETTMPYNLSNFMAGVFDVLAKNGITLDAKGKLKFSRTANPADMNPINTAWYVIKSMEPNLQNMTISQILDFRSQLRSLINYHSDAPSTKYSKNVIRQIVDGTLNKLVHKEIPELAKVDEIYSKEIDELREFKDGLVYQVGEKKGQIKDNFYSIISTINTQNRQKMKERIERIYPELGLQVEAIRMLPTLVKTYQNSPMLENNLLKTYGIFSGAKYSKNPIQLAISWLLGVVMDELISKPLGEKWRKKEIEELMNEISPEAQQKLADIKSKIDAGVELSEQEKRDLAVAMQEIAEKEYQYLDEQHKKEFDKIMESANNTQPKLPGTMDVISPDGTIKLSAGKQVNGPENYRPRTREERVQEIQKEYEVEPQTAEEMTDWYEDFMDDIGGDINGEINPREVNYERFSTKTLSKLMDDNGIPRTEKNKIQEILVKRGAEAEADSRADLDQEFAWKINKLQEEEQRVGKVGKNKVNRTEAKKQQAELEAKRERLKIEMRERYAGQGEPLDQGWIEEKYSELEGKPIDYINGYKKSKKFKEDISEKQVLEQLKGEWSKQPKFTLKMDDNMANKRQQIVEKPLKNGYEWETTDYNDRFVNKQTGDKGIIKYKPDGTVEVTFTQAGKDNAGVLEIVPTDADIRFINEEGKIEPDTIKAGELRGDEFQTVGRANPNEKTISAEEGLKTRSFKGDKTIDQLADEYGLEKQIVDKIFTDAGEEALGRARGNLVELAQWIKEGTAPHEVFHPIFNMVNAKRRAEIIDLVRKNKGITEKEAKEWLADSFSEYFRTGKFDTKPIPEGFVNKVKWFFNQVKEFVNGMWKDRKKIQKLFDDIMENKIEREGGEAKEWEYQKKKKETPEDIRAELEVALEKVPTELGGLLKNYDPDVVEWYHNIHENLVETRRPRIEDLYPIKELLEKYDEVLGEEKVPMSSMDGKEFADRRAMALQEWRDNKKSYDRLKKLGSVDRSIIMRSGKELAGLLENKIMPDFRQQFFNSSKGDMETFHMDIYPEYLYILGKTYDPDIATWKKNLAPKLDELFKKYPDELKRPMKIADVIGENRLQSLKARVKELEGYTLEEYQRVYEGEDSDVFMRGIHQAFDSAIKSGKAWEEPVQKLVALSGLDWETLQSNIKEWNGKSPMPSIAVTDPNVPHQWRDYTYVFGKDTVDPEVSIENRLYGSDAFTPQHVSSWTRNRMTFETIKDHTEKMIDDIVKKGALWDTEQADKIKYFIENELLRYSSRSDLVQNADRLAEQIVDDLSEEFRLDPEENEGPIIDMQQKIEDFLTENGEPEKYIPGNKFGKEPLTKLTPNDILGDAYEIVREMDPEGQKFKTFKEGYKNGDIDRLTGEYDVDDPQGLIDGMAEAVAQALINIRESYPEDARHRSEVYLSMRDGPDKNNKVVKKVMDKLYPSGDRPYTPENELLAKMNQPEASADRSTVPGEYRDMIQALGTRIYSLNDVRKLNLAKTTTDEFIGDFRHLEKRYNSLVDMIAKDYLDFLEPEAVLEGIDRKSAVQMEIADTYDPDINTRKERIKEYYADALYDVPDDVLQRIIDVVEQGKKVPRKFVESKPYRVVDLFKEVKYIMAPDHQVEKVKELVKGTPLEGKVQGYGSSTRNDTQGKEIRRLQKKYGNIFFSMGGAIMPIAMLYMMMQGDEEGQQA